MRDKSQKRSYLYQTPRLYVRGLQLKDIHGNYAGWFNDGEVCKYNSHGAFPKSKKELASYVRSMYENNDKIVWAVIDRKTGSHIGNISLLCLDWINRSAEFAVIIGEKDHWGKGYATEAAILLLDHGFNKLNLNRIYCGTAATNLGMQKVASNLKMKREGVRRKALYLSGKYADVYEYGILRDEFNRSKNKSD